MRSLGIDLEPWVKKRLLRFAAARPTLFGLEMHLVTIHKAIAEFKPTAVVVDPISNLMTSASTLEVKSMLIRLIDYLKEKQITSFCTDLTTAANDLEQTEVGISSLMDTWLLLKAIEDKGERNRGLCILKSRGMAHSNQIREFILSDQGIQLLDVYTGAGGVLTGAARSAQETQDKAEEAKRSLEIGRKQREIDRKEKMVEAQIAALRGEFEAEREELLKILEQGEIEEDILSEQILKIGRMRKADPIYGSAEAGNPGGKDEK